MPRTSVVLLASIYFICGSAFAADEFPDELIEFLKPGMKIGIDSFNKESENIEIHIWTEDRFALEIDAQQMEFTDLKEKYPAVSKASEELSQRTVDGVNPGRLRFVPYWIPQFTPMTVMHVGNNYLLLQMPEKSDLRIAIASDRIRTVRWGNDALSIGRKPIGPTRQPSKAAKVEPGSE